jgi:histidinol-phosphate aminotransferase
MAPTPTFSMYRQISLATATEFAGVPLNEDFSLQGDTLLGAIDRLQPACVFLAIPNNPTGNAFDPGIIEEVVQAAPGLVVIDEAYHAFYGKSWLDQITSQGNTLLLRTMSKSGLAGLRLGMLMAGTEWIDQLEKLRLPYNINALTQASVTFLLGHHHLMETQAQKIIDDRATLFQNLAAIEGVTAYPSETNFILFRLAQSAPDVFDGLVKRGVLVKNLHGSDPMLDNCLRVTVSSTSENTLFVEALASTLVAMYLY